jgi:hypothetical protein
VIDLDKIRAAVKRWAPHAAPVAIGVAALAGGVVVGVTLTTLGVRAAVALGASKGDLAIMVAGVVAVASANTLWWWFRGRDQAAKARHAEWLAAAWRREYAMQAGELRALQKENVRLAAEVERLAPGEVVSLLTKRMGEGS